MPVIVTDPGVQSQVNKAADLTVKKAGDLAGAKVDLFTNNINPTPQNVLGDFTLPTLTGYAQMTVVGWTANELPLDGSVSTDSTNVMSWTGPGDNTGQTVYGYIIRSAAVGGPLIRAVRFASPVSLSTPTDVLNLVASFVLP